MAEHRHCAAGQAVLHGRFAAMPTDRPDCILVPGKTVAERCPWCKARLTKMLRITSIMAVLALAAVAQANTGTPDSSLSCSNGLFCANGETCMSNTQGAGAKFACSPHPNAVICSDLRHSCPSGSTCTNEMCTPSDGSASLPFKASTSKDAVSVGERTYGNGIYIHPSDAPGHVNDFGSDFCKLIAPGLANSCSCSSHIMNQTVSGWINCNAHIGNFIQTSTLISFSPLAISCGWGGCVYNGTGMFYAFGGISGNVPNFPANFQTSFHISEASLSFFGKGISTRVTLSVTAINPNVVNVAIDLHACVEIGSVPPQYVQNGTVAEGHSYEKPNVVCSNQPGVHNLLGFVNVTGATLSPPTITFERFAYLSGLKWPLLQLFSHFVLVNHQLSDPVSRTVPISVMSNTFDLTDIINANRRN